MSEKKNESKIQVLLPNDTLKQLKILISSASIHRQDLVTISSYVRDLIDNHLKDYQGEQTSFVNEHIQKIYDEFIKNKNKN
jgi:hypothetical protein